MKHGRCFFVQSLITNSDEQPTGISDSVLNCGKTVFMELIKGLDGNFKATRMNQMLWQTILGITRGEDLWLYNQKLSNYHVMHELAAHESTVSDVERALSSPRCTVQSFFSLMASTGDGQLEIWWDLHSHLYKVLIISVAVRFSHACKSLSLQQSLLRVEEIITSLQT